MVCEEFHEKYGYCFKQYIVISHCLVAVLNDTHSCCPK